MIIDSHAHYTDEQFTEDLEQVFARCQTAGIEKICNVSYNLSSIDETIRLMEKYDFIYGMLGIHPSDSAPLTEELLASIARKLSLPKVVAVGEIGLDYHWDTPDRDTQKKWFRAQMEMARTANLPVDIHSRDACADTLEILREFPDVTGIIHCYSYSKESARDFLNLGYAFGIGGVVTYKNAAKLKEAVEYIPMDCILLETDCPYLAPVPNRGKRNESSNIPYIIEEIARIKGMDVATVEQTCYENTKRILHIP
ncbi:MAG: TatD family hydrolase [Lachnospiraceae bacterium]|nr:TatD family hydrolase [Lachnospiraceae bacterium]